MRCSTIEAVPVGRLFLRLVDLLPMPSLRVQRIIAFLVILTQGGIAVTGAIVRVTASGLGCPTWPQCFPGSFTPVPVAEVPVVHQVVEFGNRMITFVLTAIAVATFAAAWQTGRRSGPRALVRDGSDEDVDLGGVLDGAAGLHGRPQSEVRSDGSTSSACAILRIVEKRGSTSSFSILESCF